MLATSNRSIGRLRVWIENQKSQIEIALHARYTYLIRPVDATLFRLGRKASDDGAGFLKKEEDRSINSA